MKYDTFVESDSISPYERIQIDLVNSAIELYQKQQYELADFIYQSNFELQQQLFNDGVSNHILKTKDQYDNFYNKTVNGAYSEDVNEWIKDWKQIRKSGEYNNSFFIALEKRRKEFESNNINYTLKDKIKYYKNRVYDNGLTPGQRNYARKFLLENGINV